MHTRIKYNYNGPIGISKQLFRVRGRDLRVMIHTTDFYYEIVDIDGNLVEKGGNTKNLTVLKRQAKRAMVQQGYNFGEENRKRETGLSDEGRTSADL